MSQSQISQSIAFARGTEPLLTFSLLTVLSTQVALVAERFPPQSLGTFTIDILTLGRAQKVTD